MTLAVSHVGRSLYVGGVASDRHRGAIRAQLGAALAEQIRGLDIFLGRVWQLASGFGIVGGIALALTGTATLGITASAVSGFFFSFFTLQVWLLEKRHGGPWLVLLTHAMEGTVPWIFFYVLVRTEGAAYALGSWVAPLLIGVLIITATVRLRPLAPLVLGVVGGVTFFVLYVILVRPRLEGDERAAELYSLRMQISRAIAIGIGGALASLVAYKLRDVIGRAERAVREQDLFGKYRLESKIASGGMGVVHRATYCPEGGFERVVAVKLLHPHLAGEESVLTAFRAEAELSAKLVHPNIVQVLDFGRTGDAYFLAMEFVDGLTFGALLRRLAAAKRELNSDIVAYVGREILAGLVYSHTGARDASGTALRVVHRDLCPANVLCSRSGQVKIADFGIARALRDTDTSRTRTVAGHLGYMAPEQVRAENIDERWDVYAAGVILWELFALKPMFSRGSEAQTLLAIMAGDVPSITSVRPDLDLRWHAFLARAMELDPASRFPSAKTMLEALEALADPHDASPSAALASLVSWAMEQPKPTLQDDVETQIANPEREAPTRKLGAAAAS